MHIYEYKDKLMASFDIYPQFNEIKMSLNDIESRDIYFLTKLDLHKTKGRFRVLAPYELYDGEDIEILNKNSEGKRKSNKEIESLINRNNVIGINTNYEDFEESINYIKPVNWKVNILGMGDVGGTLTSALRLLGRDVISSIGIYDIDKNKVKRWEHECGQISTPFNYESFPRVYSLDFENVFDCDMFVFCVSKAVPQINSNVKDVRMIQYEENSKIIRGFAEMARGKNYKGIFAVVSDPVDQLCSAVLNYSNIKNGKFDYKGLKPEQIRGFGLGVMNSRAFFYASRNDKFKSYLKNGRVYGPHGSGLIAANDILNYDDEVSKELTEMVLKANFEIRKAGFKPYIAPSISSGALSIISYMKGDWHYSSSFIDGVYFGALNRELESGTEYERNNLDPKLFEKIKITYRGLFEFNV